MGRMSVVFWALSCAALIAVGCSDDAGTSQTGDTGGNDTGGDTGGDDTGGDTGGDDTGGDDTSPDLPPLPEACGAGDCTDPQACVGGSCVDPVDDLDGYADDAAGRDSSYFWAIQLPALLPGVPTCCFDYDGDAQRRPDDDLGGLIGLLGSIPGAEDLDVQATLDESIEDGTITLVTDWRELPSGDGDAQFSIFLASNDLDGDEAPDTEFDDTPEAAGLNPDDCGDTTRCGGAGTFALEPDAFGTHGSQVQFNVASRTGNVLRAGPSTFNLTLAIEALGDEPLEIELLNARIEAPISIDDDGVHTIDEVLNEGTDEELFVGGGKLGGVIDGQELIALIDSQLQLCGCAGVTEGDPVLISRVEVDEDSPANCAQNGTCEGEFIVECTENVGDGGAGCGAEGDGPLCEQIGTLCDFVDILPGVLRVDLDGDGIDDSMSAGLRFAWTGATIDGLVE